MPSQGKLLTIGLNLIPRIIHEMDISKLDNIFGKTLQLSIFETDTDKLSTVKK